MHRSHLKTGAICGALAVGLGAFGAHSLKELVTPETVSTFQTGAQYQMYHSLALLAVGIVHQRYSRKWLHLAGICFIMGIIFFSGSLYVLTILKANETVGLSGIGLLTPIGGLFFIIGWMMFFWGIVKGEDIRQEGG